MTALPKLDPKQCMVCRRVIPTSHFGACRSSKDGLRLDCKLCVNLVKRRMYFAKHGHAKPDLNPIPTTNPSFKNHNDQVVSLGLLRQTYECLGHHVISHNQYKVEFSMVDFLARIDVTNLKDGSVASMKDGSADVEEFKALILVWLYQKNIRLEKNELDLHVALREIYFI